jgi:histidyl-tRNA synthetase
MQRQFDMALEHWIPLIVWVAEDELKNGLLKIKSLNKEEQYDIKRVELKEKIFEILNDGNQVLLPPELRAQQKSEAG